MQCRDVSVGPVRLAVAEAGAGGTPLLLVHGFTGAKDDFAEWLDPLADAGWWGVAPDLRGHGESDHPPAETDYSLAQFAADVCALIDELGWSRLVLLGHSMGGMIAQLVALQRPERLAGLILMDTSSGPVAIDRAQAELAVSIVRAQGIEALLRAMKALAADGGGPLGTPAHERLLATRAGYAEFGDRKLQASSAAMYAAMATEMFEQPDRLDALRHLDVPTQVVVGEQDEPFLAAMARIAAAIPGCRSAVIPGAGHSPQFEAPDAWWAVVSGFLDEVRGPTGSGWLAP